MDELALLLDKIHASEDLVERAEAFFKEKSSNWSDGVAMQFEKFLERKRDQIHYEQYRAECMGWKLALEEDRDPPLNI